MKFQPLQAVLADADDSLYLRLNTPSGDPDHFVWYKPNEEGFEIVSDAKADSLEDAYQSREYHEGIKQ